MRLWRLDCGSPIRLFVAALFLLVLGACDWTPKHIVLIRLDSEQEFVRASLTSENVEPRIHLPLKWVDDNTWQTTVGLPRGRYMFVARSSDGRYYQHPLDYAEPNRNYTLPGKSKSTTGTQLEPEDGPGPVLKFQIPGTHRLNGREAFVIANGKRTLVQRGYVGNGVLQVRLPEPGSYTLHIAIPGDPPLDAHLGLTEILADRDMGYIQFTLPK